MDFWTLPSLVLRLRGKEQSSKILDDAKFTTMSTMFFFIVAQWLGGHMYVVLPYHIIDRCNFALDPLHVDVGIIMLIERP